MRMIFFALLVLPAVAFAQSVFYCDVAGKKLVTDQSCDKLGATTKSVRSAESYSPKSGLGGLTPGEQRMAEEYRQRDAIEDARREQIRQQRIAAAEQERRNAAATCQALKVERDRVQREQRYNSTPWHNDRIRDIDSDMSRLNCSRI